MTPLILAVDTTGEHGSIALARGTAVLGETALYSPAGYSTILYGEIEGLLTRCGVRVAEVECFAAASGPGSFTGVRVGLACVKGLAEALGRKAVAVSNLEALARCGSGARRGAVIDARRGEVYGAVYDAEGGVVSPEVVAPLAAWIESLPEGVAEIVSALPVPGKSVIAPPEALAGVIAAIAAERFARGEACDAAGLDANYVRRSDAELFWRE
ncbi:MAG: tRNA (adenosine(37)-N6)-threonylcarbamoyltransferase complex dimerization subunit type 1 TsaB [Acidobacteriota bacterium]|nr:tRNA (adenosine(37)-N6)-threonylcarbamoyltransferase complex dimerization subunit type 1 TsaB [Acidobacteriota bacterium]